MTDMMPRGAGRRRGRDARLLAAGALACGAVLLPATAASAMTDGMLCPMAVGDASNPATAAPPTRSAPNETPLGAKPAAVVTKPSPGRAASPPASKAPAERASATQPASAPATVTAHKSTGAGAVATRPAAAPVVQRPAVAAPVARPSAPAPRAHRAAPAKRSAPAPRAHAPRAVAPVIIADVTRPSAGSAPQIGAAPASSADGGAGWQALGVALALLAIAAAVFRARRRRGVQMPLAPVVVGAAATTFDEVESVVRELLARTQDRDALVNAESGRDASEAPVTVAG